MVIHPDDDAAQCLPTVEDNNGEAEHSGTDDPERVSRRKAFRLGLAGAVAAGALALGARPDSVQAADGDYLKLGSLDNEATSTTHLTLNVGAYNDALTIESNADTTIAVSNTELGYGPSDANGDAISARSITRRALHATSEHNMAIHAESLGDDAFPTILATKGTTSGYIPELPGTAIRAVSDDGVGLRAESSVGPSVLAENHTGGLALEVRGSATFTGPVTFQAGFQLGGLAGTASIPRRRRSVTIANPNITATSIILLTPVASPMMFMGAWAPWMTLWYERKPGQGFVVSVSVAPMYTDLEFSYFIAQY